MNGATLSNEIALRIGLAARALPDTDPARLLKVLDDAVGLPPSESDLSTLTVKELKAAADGELGDIDVQALKSALAYLKGETGSDSEPLPTVEAYQEGDMPNSIRVACASNTGGNLDGHFGSCVRFLVYQVGAGGASLVDIRPVEESEAGEDEDKNAYRSRLINDCQVLFVASIGGPAAARVVKAGVHPIKKPSAGLALDEVNALCKVIGAGAPPWLAKVMGAAPEERVRFDVGADGLEEAGA